MTFMTFKEDSLVVMHANYISDLLVTMIQALQGGPDRDQRNIIEDEIADISYTETFKVLDCSK